MTEIKIEDLKVLCEKVLTAKGFRTQDTSIIVDHLMENQCSGKASHGMVRLPEIIRTINKHGLSVSDPKICYDQGNIAVIDACGQIGVVAGKYATDQSISRAKEHGLAMVGIRNYIGTSGSMAYYLRRLAHEGLIAIMGCNSVAMVAPPAGKQRVIGTNPIGIAVPGQDEDALIADLATSAIAYGKIMVMNDQGEDVPEGVMIDQDGNPSINPKDAYEGAILPLAGHKGFALGLMVELLAGPLMGAKAIKQNDYDGDGLFIIAINPHHFGNKDYYSQVSVALKEIIDSRPRAGYECVSIAGQRSEDFLKQTNKSGIVNVAEKTLRDIRALIGAN